MPLSSIGAVSGPNPEKLTIERLYASPGLNGPSPQSLRFTPDGTRVTFLKGKEGDYRQLDLWVCDVATGEERLLVDSALLSATEELSEEEKARRERQRQFSHGITEYVAAKNGQYLVFPINGQIFYCDMKQKAQQLQRLTGDSENATDVQCSPRSRYVSYVTGQDLYVHDTVRDLTLRLTDDGGGPIKNGMAEYIAQEEMGRFTGYWWSDNDRHIAYLRVDESPVMPRYELSHNGTRLRQCSYPFAGTSNVTVRLFVRDLFADEAIEVDLGANKDIYVARVHWEVGGKSLLIQRQDREQKRLELIRYDCETGAQTVVLTETAKDWVNLNDDLRSLKAQASFLWASERTGFKHLYLYAKDGSVCTQLTEGEWAVNKVLGLDEEAGYVYFDGFYSHPLQKHVYRVSLNEPGKIEQITSEEGWHDARFSADYKYFIDQFSSTRTPPQVSLRSVADGHLRFVEENRLDASHPYHIYLEAQQPPEFGTVKADDGTTLHYKLIKPFPFEPSIRYPVIVRIYGGPHARKVKDQWDEGDAWSHIMANRGFVVFSLDNRGSCDRGKAFEAAIHRQLGEVELKDQLKGVEHLKTLDFIDPQRIGMFGWSYGGYMTLMALLKAPDTFTAGVAVAPVTDWTLYDTHYTERYLDLPQNNADGYKASGVYPY
ncbi:MAG: S9 family peptidase, partial [Chlamydiia bacterium]|nr:S9 family peptidase [Chlamydiia bacterium]